MASKNLTVLGTTFTLRFSSPAMYISLAIISLNILAYLSFSDMPSIDCFDMACPKEHAYYEIKQRLDMICSHWTIHHKDSYNDLCTNLPQCVMSPNDWNQFASFAGWVSRVQWYPLWVLGVVLCVYGAVQDPKNVFTHIVSLPRTLLLRLAYEWYMGRGIASTFCYALTLHGAMCGSVMAVTFWALDPRRLVEAPVDKTG